MKSFVLPTCLCVCGAFLCYLGLHAFDPTKDVAEKFSSIILCAVIPVRDAIEKIKEKKVAESAVPPVQSLNAYDINPALAIMYVSFVGLAALNFAGGVGGLITASVRNPLEDLLAPLFILTLVIAYPILFLCGRWIGRRCARRPLLVAACAAIAVRVLTSFFDFTFIPASDYKKIMGFTNSISWALIQLLFGSIIFAVFLVSGAALGRRQRLTDYFNYLLKQLTPASRVALIDLAYEEANRIKRSDKSQ